MAVGKSRKNYKRQTGVVVSNESIEVIQTALDERKATNPNVFKLPASKRSIYDLTEYYLKLEEGTRTVLPKEKRRYAIYIRKSTDDESKQVRSLEDQKAECLSLAKSQNIAIKETDIFSESASAKVSNNRPIFNELLQHFRTGRYQGLIAWSPDRISRNMKEAGEVIEMIDHEVIQDLQFKTYQFENNPNGKMMLGILFATSKQYSDKLSVDVKRGTHGNIGEGRYNGVIKRGYYVDETTGFFVPDAHNWDLLREAVNMRLYQNRTNIEIATFLNDSLLSVRKYEGGELRHIKISNKMVADMLADPFYCGLYQYGPSLVNLADQYDFMPLMTADEFIALNREAAENFREKPLKASFKAKKLEYGLLRGKVICDYCDSIMQFQSTPIVRGKNKGKHMLAFNCRNKSCQRYKDAENKANGIKLSRSIRAKYIMAAIEYELRHATKRSKEAYQMHLEGLKEQLAADRAIAKRKLTQANEARREHYRQYARYQELQLKDLDAYNKHHKGKLEHHQTLIDAAERNIELNTKAIAELGQDLPSEDEFFELVDSYLLRLLETTDIVEQNMICNELVSNLRAGNDSVSVIKLNPPYNLLVDFSENTSWSG